MVRCSVEMVKEKLISKDQSLLRLHPEQLEQLLHRTIDPKSKGFVPQNQRDLSNLPKE